MIEFPIIISVMDQQTNTFQTHNCWINPYCFFDEPHNNELEKFNNEQESLVNHDERIKKWYTV